MAILQYLIRPFGTLLVKPGKPQPAGSPRLTPHSYARRRCNIHERREDGIWIYDLTAKTDTNHSNTRGDPQTVASQHRVYYFAGGGFRMPPSPEHWKFCTELCSKLSNTTVSIVSYLLAPKSPGPETLPHLVRLYKTLMSKALEDGEKVSLVGDSAGGNLVLSLPLCALREEGIPPSNILAISPPVSLPNTNPDMEKAQKYDPVLSVAFVDEIAKKWAGKWDRDDPQLSPLFADLSVLRKHGVKVHGVVGNYDVLAPDAVLFRKRCEEYGVQGEWLEWEKQMHCFRLAWIYHLPESVQGKNWVIYVLGRNV